jgi:hypothetical protein
MTGPGGVQVRCLEEGAVAVWIGEGEVAGRDVDALRAHDAVVRAALRSATPLPARFGTVFVDEAELRRSLRERAEELRAALERVDGRVEMGVRLEWDEEDPPPPAEPPPEGGRAYLDWRRREFAAEEARRARADALLDLVEARIAPEGSPAVRTLLPAPGIAGFMAHLVHRHAVGVYRSKVEEARSDLPSVHLRVTGPWAPYSFV